MRRQIIERDRSVVVAADVPDFDSLNTLTRNMSGIPGIGGFKLGFTMSMQGLSVAVGVVKNILGDGFPVIYDHQKGGNDIPDMGGPFAQTLMNAGVNAAILFPFTGPATQEAWTKSCLDAGLDVIVGGVMTHPKFLVSEGGYIPDDVPERIYRLACQSGVSNFVVPGNKIDWVTRVRGYLVEELGEDNFTLWAPGFITQKGDISECGQAAGKFFHAIVGSAIYKHEDTDEQRQAAFAVTSQIAA